MKEEFLVAGSKIYKPCGYCGKLVQVNKFIFGSLHCCLTDAELKEKFQAEEQVRRQKMFHDLYRKEQ